MRAVVALALMCVLAGCSGPGIPSTSDGGPTPPFIEARDLAAIRERGVLRVLVPLVEGNGILPRRGSPMERERKLVEVYARRNGLALFWVYVDSRDDLIPRLLEGAGDVIVASLTATPERRERVTFTVPIDFVREQVVTRARDLVIEEPADLVGRRVAVRRSSSYWPTLQALAERYPEMTIEAAPEQLDTDELVHRVAQRRLDVTVADSNLMASILSYRDDVRVAFDLTIDRPIAWAVRPDSRLLLNSLNGFLNQAQIADLRDIARYDDLDEIRKRQVLRVLTRNSASTYFLWRGELLGFEYELASRFADQNDLRVEIVVPPRREELMAWLVGGRGDLVAAELTPGEDLDLDGVALSKPYNYASPVIVTRPGEADLTDLEDLAGRTVWLRQSSSYWQRLRALQNDGIDFDLQAAPEHLETEEIIALVAESAYDLTVADSHILDIELTWRTDVDAAFPLGDPVPLVWAVRQSNPALHAAIDAFIEQEYRGLFYNTIYSKYFTDSRRIRRHVEHRSIDGSLSPYDDIIKPLAEKHGFDWRMIVALMREESGFDPEVVSFAGAVGLMQVLPRTARQVGLEGLKKPAVNIEAGIKYLTWLRQRFENDLPVQERMWFTLAAYNVGNGHVRDARRLAAAKGWDRDVWFDNVERAMLLLSRPEYAREAAHGYCRGSEPVAYVRKIRSRYSSYRETLNSTPVR